MRIDEHLSVAAMTSYDRYLQQYVRSPTASFYYQHYHHYHHHDRCQQSDESGGRSAVWGTSGLGASGAETLSLDEGSSRHGGSLQQAASTPTAADVEVGEDLADSRRRGPTAPPAFSIDAILSRAGTTTMTTTGTGIEIIAELTSAAAAGDWSRGQSLVTSQQTTNAGVGENTTQLTKGKVWSPGFVCLPELCSSCAALISVSLACEAKLTHN